MGLYKFALLELKDVLLRLTHQPSESFPLAQDETQRLQCVPEIWMFIGYGFYRSMVFIGSRLTTSYDQCQPKYIVSSTFIVLRTLSKK